MRKQNQNPRTRSAAPTGRRLAHRAVLARLPDALYRRLRVTAAENDVSMAAIVNRAVADYLGAKTP
jgi:hypothetical protein